MTSPDPTTPPPTPPDPPAQGSDPGQTPPPPPPQGSDPGQTPPRRLTRSSTDQVLGGVAGGLGRYFSIDPILFRIGFAVAALAGGAGLLAYFALWLLVPDELGQGAKRPGGRDLALIAGGGIVLLVAVGLLPGPDFFIWPGFVGLLVLGLLVAAIVSADRGGDTRSRLARIVIVTLTVVAAGFLGVSAAVGTAFGGGAVVAGIVIALGLGLVAGAFGNGRRWLLVPALVLAAPATMVEAAGLHVEGGVGEREYRPSSVTELRDVYRLGAGEMVIDLRDVDFPAGRTELDVELGLGEVKILVPDDVCVASDTEIGAGVARIFDREYGDVDLEWSQRPGDGATTDLHIDTDIDFGALSIRYEWEDGWDGHDRGPFGDRHDDGPGPVSQRSCPA